MISTEVMEAGPQGVEDPIAGQLRRFLQEEVLRSDEPIAPDEPLFETGRVDSIGLLQLLEFVGREYRVDLLQRGNPADLRTLATLARAVQRERPG